MFRARSTVVLLALVGVLSALVIVGLVEAISRDRSAADASTAGVIAPAPIAGLAIGDQWNRRVPAMPLIDEHGHRTSLAAFHGKYVVLAPSMTLCHEVCPMTTGALQEIKQKVDAEGLGGKVAVVEVTVDPWRDSPARLRAFKRMTGIDFRLLTGTKADIRRLWKFFGIYYKKVPQDDPPDVDWWTHKPEKFDVVHSDALLYLDPKGHWRIGVLGMPNVDGRLEPALRKLLNDEGHENLEHPKTSWSVAGALQDLWHLMGRSAPQGAGTDGDDDSDSGTTTTDVPSRAAARAALAGSPPALASLHKQSAQLFDSDPDAVTARLRQLRGHPVVINEWASWCAPCRKELSLFQSASARYGKRVAFLGLDVNDPNPDNARKLLSQHPVSYPSYRDPDATSARSLGSFVGLPTTVFLDANGKTVFTHSGFYSNQNTLDGDIEHYALGH